MKPKIYVLFLLLLLGIGLFLRFYLLSQIPFWYYFDEMDYIFTGEAIARYGTDISGTWSPFSLRPLQLINNISELASVFHAIIQKIFGYGPGTGSVTSAVFGIFSAGITAAIAYVLTKKKYLAFAVLTILFVSPWHVYISRVSYEGVISLTFQLLMVFGFMYYLQIKKRSFKNTLFSLACVLLGAFFGYYTYHGAKFTVATVGITLSIYTLWQTQFFQKKFEVLYFILPTFLLIFSMLIHSNILKSQGAFGHRNSEIIFNQAELTKTVDVYRKQSLDFPGKNIIISKPTIFIEKSIKRYFNVFDIYQWGITGEEDIFQFSLFVHGFIYLSSLPLTFIGVHYFWKKHTPQTYVLLITIAVAPVTNVLSNFSSQSIFRSALVYALGLIFVGAGLYVLYKKYFKVFVLVFPFLILETLYFVALFFNRYPFIAADTHFIHEKQVAAYVSKATQDVVIVTANKSQSYTLARSIIYFNQWMPDLTEEEKKRFTTVQGTYSFKHVTLVDNCPIGLSTDKALILTPAKEHECDLSKIFAQDSENKRPDFSKKGLASPRDSHIYFVVFNDTLCQRSTLNTYIYQDKIEAYDMLNMSAETFCKNWMLKE